MPKKKVRSDLQKEVGQKFRGKLEAYKLIGTFAVSITLSH